MRALLLILLPLFLGGCGYDKLVSTLQTADRVRALADGREKVIDSPSEVHALTQILATPNRKWGDYSPTTPTAPQMLFFSRGGTFIGWANFAEDRLVIEFWAPKQLTISTSFSKEEYHRLVRLIWSDTKT
jgi:hypothetical protein